MQAQYELEKLQDEIPMPNVISFNDWITIKQYGNITKGTRGFVPEELDQAVVYYDEKMEFLDYLERIKIEDITPAFVLLPRFFWEDTKDRMPLDFIPHLRIPDRIALLDSSRDYWITLQNRALAEIDLLGCDAAPREEQEEIIEFFVEKMQTDHKLRGILQAAPGVGKTFMAIKLSALYRTKTLIVVPNQVLQDQWIDAIQQFTSLKEENIGIIQGSDIKKIEKDIFAEEHMDTKVIYIVKIQSLFSQIKHAHFMHLQKMYKGIDLVCYDECHNTGSATSYAKTSSLFLTPNILGLSATPYRQGLNEFLLRTSIGDTLYVAEHQNLVPDVEIHNVYIEFSEAEEGRLQRMKHDYIMYLGVFNSLVKNKQPYFDYLADTVAWNQSQGHNIVVLFPTIAMQEKLFDAIEARHPSISNGVLLLKGKTKQDSLEMVKEKRKILMNQYKDYKVDLDKQVKVKELRRKNANFLQKEKRQEIDDQIEFFKEHAIDIYKKKVKEAEVIISNYNLLSAGFDKSTLSNIIFGGAPRIGKISVIQSIGRITRIHEGKKNPLVQYFIPSKFIETQKSTSIILTKNIRVQYPEAKFKYIGFEETH